MAGSDYRAGHGVGRLDAVVRRSLSAMGQHAVIKKMLELIHDRMAGVGGARSDPGRFGFVAQKAGAARAQGAERGPF
jgi:hypothetical protein